MNMKIKLYSVVDKNEFKIREGFLEEQLII